MQGLTTLDTGIPGPTTLIVGLLHGNEVIGEQILNFITTNFADIFYQGKVILLKGNMSAFKKGVRFIDQDLNRSFGECILNNTEVKRAIEIKQYFDNINFHIDYVFDFHSTSSHSEPMIICTNNKKSQYLSRFFPIKKVILGLVDSILGKSLLKYFDEKGIIGMAFECGYHNDPNNINTAKKILRIIADIHNNMSNYMEFKQDKILITEPIKTEDRRFRFIRRFEGFDRIRKGEVYATDSKSDIIAKSDSIIVMPNINHLANLDIQKYTIVGYLGELCK